MAESLQSQVGALLGIGTPSANTLPTNDQITAWLKEGSIYVMKKAPLYVLHEEVKGTTLSYVVDDYVEDAPAGYLRFYEAYSSTTNVPYKLVEPDYGRYVMSNKNSFLDDKIVFVQGGKVYAYPTPVELAFKYLSQPADSSDVPDELHDQVIKYALMMAKKEAQELEEWVALYQELDKEIKEM